MIDAMRADSLFVRLYTPHCPRSTGPLEAGPLLWADWAAPSRACRFRLVADGETGRMGIQWDCPPPRRGDEG